MTHRCKGSLENRVSIRFTDILQELREEDKEDVTWRLFSIEEDYEYLHTYMSHVSEITYCPFCGQKLSKPHSFCYIIDGEYRKGGVD